MNTRLKHLSVVMLMTVARLYSVMDQSQNSKVQNVDILSTSRPFFPLIDQKAVKHRSENKLPDLLSNKFNGKIWPIQDGSRNKSSLRLFKVQVNVIYSWIQTTIAIIQKIKAKHIKNQLHIYPPYSMKQ